MRIGKIKNNFWTELNWYRYGCRVPKIELRNVYRVWILIVLAVPVNGNVFWLHYYLFILINAVLIKIEVHSTINGHALPVDYRFEDDRFPVSASCVTILNPDLLFSSETGVDPVLRVWESIHDNQRDVREPLAVSISQRSQDLRLYNLVLDFDNVNPLQPRLQSCTFKCVFWLHFLLFCEWWLWFSERGSQDTFFTVFASIVHASPSCFSWFHFRLQH